MRKPIIGKGWWTGQVFVGLLLFAAIGLVAAPPLAAQTPVPSPDSLSLDFSFKAPLLKRIEIEGSTYTSIASLRCPHHRPAGRRSGPAYPLREDPPSPRERGRPSVGHRILAGLCL